MKFGLSSRVIKKVLESKNPPLPFDSAKPPKPTKARQYTAMVIPESSTMPEALKTKSKIALIVSDDKDALLDILKGL